MRSSIQIRGARLTALATLVTVMLSGCGDGEPKDLADNWASMAATIAESAGSQAIVSGTGWANGALSLTLRTERGDQIWSKGNPQDEPSAADIAPAAAFTGLGTINVDAVNWERLAAITTDVECDVSASMGFRILPGGQVFDYGNCQSSVQGSSAVDGVLLPDSFDVATAAGLDEALSWARQLSPNGQARFFYTSPTIHQISLRGDVIEGIPHGDASEPCVAGYTFPAEVRPTPNVNIAYCGGTPYVVAPKGVPFDLDRVTGALIIEMQDALQKQAWWEPEATLSFEFSSVDANSLEATLTHDGPPPSGELPREVTAQFPLP